jgi:hypothetical protein
VFDCSGFARIVEVIIACGVRNSHKTDAAAEHYDLTHSQKSPVEACTQGTGDEEDSQ